MGAVAVGFDVVSVDVISTDLGDNVDVFMLVEPDEAVVLSAKVQCYQHTCNTFYQDCIMRDQ